MSIPKLLNEAALLQADPDLLKAAWAQYEALVSALNACNAALFDDLVEPGLGYVKRRRLAKQATYEALQSIDHETRRSEGR